MAIPVRRVIPATARIRVLVVDDSVVIRRLVTQALGEDPGIEVVAAAAHGAIEERASGVERRDTGLIGGAGPARRASPQRVRFGIDGVQRQPLALVLDPRRAVEERA